MKRKVLLYVAAIIVAIISAYVLEKTYAVFETDSLGTTDFDIGSWVIKLNDIDISSGETINFSMNNFVYTENSHIKNGYIAPGRSGYFDVILDPSGTDVAIRYDITLDIEGEYQDNITYYVTTTDGNTIRTGENTYSGILDLDSLEDGEVATLRITIEWVNDSNHDESDTELGITRTNNISIPATINVVQYLGETLTEYQEE